MKEANSELWTDARIELMKQLAADGFSASEITARLNMGVTRNAVLGKMHRLGIRLNSRHAQALRQVRTDPEMARAVEPGLRNLAKPMPVIKVKRKLYGPQQPRTGAPARQRPLSDDPALLFSEGFLGQKGRVSLQQLREHHCKFPIDQAEGPVRYCGDTPSGGSPYCTHHRDRCENRGWRKGPKSAPPEPFPRLKHDGALR